MKNLMMITATSLLLATSASAGSITFSIPNLWFPPVDDTTVSKDSLTSDTTSVLAIPQE